MEIEDFSYMLRKNGDGKGVVSLSIPLSYMSYDYKAGVKKHWDRKAKRFAELASLCRRLELPNMVCQTAGMLMHKFLAGYYGKVYGVYNKFLPHAIIYIATYLHKYQLPINSLFNSKSEAKRGRKAVLHVISYNFMPVENISFIKSRIDEAIAIINREASRFGLTDLDIAHAYEILRRMKVSAGITPKSMAAIAMYASLLMRCEYLGLSKFDEDMKIHRPNEKVYIEAVGE